VNTVTACTDRVDVDALLIRADGCVALASPTGQDLGVTSLMRCTGYLVRPIGLERRINSRLRIRSIGSGRQISDLIRM
jgi:hypothetical protein